MLSGPKIQTALVGFGMGGSVFHAPFIQASLRFELAVVVTSNPERQRAIRTDYPEARVVSSFEDLRANIDPIDLVVVSTPNRTHVPLAEAVLQLGRHVVVDKPVAPTADATRRLVQLADEVGRVLVPFYNRRWDGDFRTVGAILRSGRLGTIYRFESRYERWQPVIDPEAGRSWKRDPTPGHATGILYDLGTHLIDQAASAFGRPDGVYAEIERRRPGASVDDDVFLALEYPGGMRAHLWASAVAADRGPRFRLLGSEGAYVKYGMDVQEAALLAGRRPSDSTWGAESTEAWGVMTTGEDSWREPTLPGAYQLFYEGLAACLLDGAAPPVAAADAVVVAEILDMAQTRYRS